VLAVRAGRHCTEQRGGLDRRQGRAALAVGEAPAMCRVQGPVRACRQRTFGLWPLNWAVGAGSSNGRTPDSGSGSLGSSPSPAASGTRRKRRVSRFLARRRNDDGATDGARRGRRSRAGRAFGEERLAHYLFNSSKREAAKGKDAPRTSGGAVAAGDVRDWVRRQRAARDPGGEQ